MPAPRKLQQEDNVFQASLGYLARPCLKTKKEGKKGNGQDDSRLHIPIKRLKKTDVETVWPTGRRPRDGGDAVFPAANSS